MVWIQGQEQEIPITIDLSHRTRPHTISLPVVYFDGALSDGVCSCGAWIKLDNNDQYHMYWNGGKGTNNKEELLALWSGLWVSHNLSLQSINIYGDSKIIIDGICGMASF